MSSNRPQTYDNGRPYSVAEGRFAPRRQIVDELASRLVIDLEMSEPSTAEFMQTIVRELRIRFYKQKTVQSYRRMLAQFLRWFGAPPHLVRREDVRCWLEAVVLGGASSATVSNHLSVIRTAFDKMCGRDVTYGLRTPRRQTRLPVVLSEKEVLRILQAAPSLRDKLLLGLMYATGMRVSEVVRLRWRDVDFDRRRVSIWQGKGSTDRKVMLPASFEPLLRELSRQFNPEDFIFPSQNPGRYLSPRTAQRAMERAVTIARIGKRGHTTLTAPRVCHASARKWHGHSLHPEVAGACASGNDDDLCQGGGIETAGSRESAGPGDPYWHATDRRSSAISTPGGTDADRPQTSARGGE